MGRHSETDSGNVKKKNLKPGTKGHCRVTNYCLDVTDRSRKSTLKDTRPFFLFLPFRAPTPPLLSF